MHGFGMELVNHKEDTLKEVIRLWKENDYRSVFQILKKEKYDYTIDNLDKDFRKINSMNKYGYLIYLLANDFSVKNVLLFCDFLTYTDTFFCDIHPVIRMVVNRAIELFPTERNLLRWIVGTYENHPDSPFTETELIVFKEKISK